MVTLSTIDVAPKRSEGTGARAPQRIWSLLGYPTLHYPIGHIDGLPFGAQLISRPNYEDLLLGLAEV